MLVNTNNKVNVEAIPLTAKEIKQAAEADPTQLPSNVDFKRPDKQGMADVSLTLSGVIKAEVAARQAYAEGASPDLVVQLHETIMNRAVAKEGKRLEPPNPRPEENKEESVSIAQTEAQAIKKQQHITLEENNRKQQEIEEKQKEQIALQMFANSSNQTTTSQNIAQVPQFQLSPSSPLNFSIKAYVAEGSPELDSLRKNLRNIA